MILEEETYKKFGYYPMGLMRRSGKKILAACDECGKIRETTKHDYRALCPSCAIKGDRHPNYGKHFTLKTKNKISTANKGKLNGYKHPNWKGGLVRRKCRECGKEFLIKPSKVRRGGGIFCSRVCKRLALSKRMGGANNPSWKGGKIKRLCTLCGQPFLASSFQVSKGAGLFCSHSCAAKAQRYNARPHKTHPELLFEGICTKYSLPFKFVGDGSLWINNANPDFIHNTRKLCVEIFGDYWHSPLLNRNIRGTHTLEGRRQQLKAEGYKLIVLWETDLMREDAESFVLGVLRKEKIIKAAIDKAV